MSADENFEYDETKAIAFMRGRLSEDKAHKYDDDELLNVIDMIWDYYEANGLLDFDSDDVSDNDELADIVAYVKRMLAKDKDALVAPEDVKELVEAELAYEDSIGLGED